MKVLLVCMSGITTKILSTRLHNYSIEHGHNDEFIPCRIGTSVEFIDTVDVVLLSPQAEFFYKTITEKSMESNTKVVMLDEKMFVNGKVEDIYNYVRRSVIVERDFGNPTVSLDLRLICKILVESLLGCFPIVLFGMLAYFISYVPQLSFCYSLFEATIGCISIFFAYAIGFKYGSNSNTNPYVMGLFTFATSMMTKNMVDFHIEIQPHLPIANGVFTILTTMAKDFLVVSVLSILTVSLFELLRKVLKINFRADYQSMIMVSQSIVFSLILLAFLIIRVIFKN